MRKHPLLALGTITLLLGLALIGLALTDTPTAYSSELPAQNARLSHVRAPSSHSATVRRRRAAALALARRRHARAIALARRRHARAVALERHRRAVLAAARARRAAAARLERLVAEHKVPAGGVWQSLRDCESGGNYREDTGNGYYGAYQFSAATWHAVGFGGLPNEAPFYVQDEAAQRLEAERGWQPWPVCSVKLDL